MGFLFLLNRLLLRRRYQSPTQCYNELNALKGGLPIILFLRVGQVFIRHHAGGRFGFAVLYLAIGPTFSLATFCPYLMGIFCDIFGQLIQLLRKGDSACVCGFGVVSHKNNLLWNNTTRLS